MHVAWTHRLCVDRVDSEQECGDEGQVCLLEDAALTGEHQQASNYGVKTHVHGMKVDRCHSTEQDVQPERQHHQWFWTGTISRHAM